MYTMYMYKTRRPNNTPILCLPRTRLGVSFPWFVWGCMRVWAFSLGIRRVASLSVLFVIFFLFSYMFFFVCFPFYWFFFFRFLLYFLFVFLYKLLARPSTAWHHFQDPCSWTCSCSCSDGCSWTVFMNTCSWTLFEQAPRPSYSCASQSSSSCC